MRKEELENRVTSFLSSHSPTLSCPSDNIPQGKLLKICADKEGWGVLSYFFTCFLFGSLCKCRTLSPAGSLLY